MRRSAPLLAALSLLLAAGCEPRQEATHAPAANAPAAGGAATAATPGAALYQQYCQACHGPQGQGVPNAGVSLVHASGEAEAELREVIRNGRGNMPAFKDQLTDEQITAVIQHLRTFSRGGGPSGDERNHHHEHDHHEHDHHEHDGHEHDGPGQPP